MLLGHLVKQEEQTAAMRHTVLMTRTAETAALNHQDISMAGS
jgi:hypothetical protein